MANKIGLFFLMGHTYCIILNVLCEAFLLAGLSEIIQFVMDILNLSNMNPDVANKKHVLKYWFCDCQHGHLFHAQAEYLLAK